MNQSDLRKKLLRYYDLLREIKSIQARTSHQRDNQTREIKALEVIIEKTKENLYGRENKK